MTTVRVIQLFYFFFYCSVELVTVGDAGPFVSTTPSDVKETTVAVKNMLASKCFAYPVQIYAFPDEVVHLGLTSVTFENCDAELSLGSSSTVTDIPYGVMGKGQVLSMPVEKGCGRKEGLGNPRTGAFRVTATVDSDSEEIIAIVNPDSDLKPVGPPTYTINSDEDVDLEVDYAYPNEIVWAMDGRIIQKWKGLLTINVDQGGIYQAFSKKLGREIRITYRVIKRACEAGKYGPPECAGDCPATCTPGVGVCDDSDGTCVCAPGTVQGTSCQTNGPTFGTNEDLKCEEQGLAYPGCKGILFCKRDPYGCSCLFGYGGVDCTMECPSGSYGHNCELEDTPGMT